MNKSLADISVGQVHEAQQGALMHLQLFVLGEVHRLLGEVNTAVLDALRRFPGDQPLPPAGETIVRQAANNAWDTFISQYTQLIAVAMREAASIPFGTWAVYHAAYILPYANEVQEAIRPFQEQTATNDVLFKPQLQALIDAAYRRTYHDGLNLSRRIWQLDTYGRSGLNNAIVLAIANANSAWQLAQSVEQFLGPGQDCPRWTYDRLSELTKADIAAGNTLGLYSGDECRGQGVSYNALRLARTEIQAIHHMATDMIFKTMPWIEQEQVNLSPEHAEIDECDDAASGGETNNGVYPKGTITLPIHSNCLCYKTAVLMDNQAFVNKLRGWMHGEAAWSEMDQYAASLPYGWRMDLRESKIGYSMAYWLWESPVNFAALFWAIAGG